MSSHGSDARGDPPGGSSGRDNDGNDRKNTNGNKKKNRKKGKDDSKKNRNEDGNSGNDKKDDAGNNKKEDTGNKKGDSENKDERDERIRKLEEELRTMNEKMLEAMELIKTGNTVGNTVGNSSGNEDGNTEVNTDTGNTTTTRSGNDETSVGTSSAGLGTFDDLSLSDEDIVKINRARDTATELAADRARIQFRRSVVPPGRSNSGNYGNGPDSRNDGNSRQQGGSGNYRNDMNYGNDRNDQLGGDRSSTFYRNDYDDVGVQIDYTGYEHILTPELRRDRSRGPPNYCEICDMYGHHRGICRFSHVGDDSRGCTRCGMTNEHYRRACEVPDSHLRSVQLGTSQVGQEVLDAWMAVARRTQGTVWNPVSR
eukprot:Rmarinus@m.8733